MDEQTKRKISYALRGRKKLANQPKTKQHKQAISKGMKAYWLKKNN